MTAGRPTIGASGVRMELTSNRGSDAPVAARRLREPTGQDPGRAPERAPAQAALL